MMTNLYVCAMTAAFRVKKKLKSFFEKEDGAVDFVAIAIILVITVTLAIVFREQIAQLFTNIWNSIGQKSGADFEINGLETP